VKVLVKEKIADSGVDLLRSQFEVDLGLEMSEEELREKIGSYDAILIRSATQMTPELIELADNLKVIGRAGTGVDNVDIPAATRRGIIVANAPESNSVAAAEHTLALALALFRNAPQAHRSLVEGRWDRAKFKGAELYGKTLGVIGFGRGHRASRWRSSPSTSSSPPSASATSGSREPRASRRCSAAPT
jgi:D-3-phosphoglycerate dehydrogenase